MPIRPIDMQTMIPKMEKIEAARNKAVNRTDNDTQQNQIQTKIEADLKSKQVNTLKQKDQNAVKNDDRDKARQEAGQDQNHKDSHEEETRDDQTKNTKKIIRGHFDMKV